MKNMKLIKTQDYLLLIDEEDDIVNGDYFIKDSPPLYFKPKRFIEKRDVFPPTTKCNKITAYYPLTKEAKELDLPLIPNPWEENIEKMWLDFNKNHNRNCPLGKEQFVRAMNYKEATKQFSLEDIKKVIDLTQQICDRNVHYVQRDRNVHVPMITIDEEEEIIQSLSTQQLPKEFKPIMVCGRCLKPDDDDEDCWSAKECSRNTDFPDKFKTITNSEGKEEIVGTYKYNTKKS